MVDCCENGRVARGVFRTDMLCICRDISLLIKHIFEWCIHDINVFEYV
jgi:hypothetical protein